MANIRLKPLRIARGFTQSDMAKKLGVTPSAYAMYERGEREPGIENLIKISEILNVDINILLGVTNPPPGEVENLTDGERMLLDLFRSAGPYQQEIILRLLSAEITPKG